MEVTLNLISYILLVLSVTFFILGLRQRKLLKEEVNKKNETLKMCEFKYNEFRLLVAGVTHEINNALTIILGRLSLLIKKNQDSELGKDLTILLVTSNRIANSVVSLRQVIYPSEFEEEENIELSVLLEDVLKLTGQRLRNHGIEMKLKGTEHKVIKGRKNQLEKLVINLINQSIERLHSMEYRWIQIVAVEESGRLNLYFMDSSGEVGDKIDHKQFSDILEENHGHLTVNQNNLILELPQAPKERFHF